MRFEYSSGGETLHRGYYCPSPVDDLIFGGCRRGKLLKRLTKRTNPSYRYEFAADSRMLFVDKLCTCEKEVIVHENNSEIGLTISSAAISAR